MKNETADDLRSFGVPESEIERLAPKVENFGVFPENWPAVELFMRLQTQWQIVNGGFLGLQYTAVDALMRILRVKDRAQVFQDLQIMELAALRVLNEKKG